MKLNLAAKLIPIFLLLSGCAHVAWEEDTTTVETSQALTPLAEPDLQIETPSKPFTPEVLFTLLVAEMGLKRDRYDIAITHYLHALSNVEDKGVAERATKLSFQAGAISQALVAAQEWVDLDKKNLEAQSYAASLFVATGDPALAAPHLNGVMASSDSSSLLFQLLHSMARRNSLEIEGVQYLADTYPANLDTRVLYAQVLFNHQQIEQANTIVNEVLRSEEYRPNAVALKVQMLEQSKSFDEAINLLREALFVHPEHVGMRIGLLKMLIEADRTQEMRDEYPALQKLLASDPTNLAQAGFLSLQAKHYRQSERFLLQSIQYGMPVEHIAYYLGHISDAQGDPVSAVRWYKMVGGSNNNQKFFAEIRAAILLSETESYEAALTYLESVQPNNATQQKQLALLRGELLQDQNRWQDAFDVYSIALDHFNNDIQLLYARSLAADKLRRLDLAEQDLSQILVQDPSNVLALNALGYSLSNHSNRYEEALIYIERALHLSPEDAAILDSMGWVKFRLGDYDEALSYLSEALDITWDGEIAAHLGEVLWTMGETERAQEVIEEGLELAPDNHHLLDVFRRLFQ